MDGDIFSNQFFGVEIIKFVVDCLLFSFKDHNYTSIFAFKLPERVELSIIVAN